MGDEDGGGRAVWVSRVVIHQMEYTRTAITHLDV